MAVKIKLTKGAYALVDDIDCGRVNQWKWHLVGGRYAAHRLPADENYKSGKYVYMHRFIMGTPDDMDTDHINGDGLDNRRANLRICSTSQNIMNTTRKNLFGYKGVTYSGKRFVAQFCARRDGRTNTVRLGTFNTPEEAAKAYDRHVYSIYGDFAKLNFGKRG